MSANSRVSAIEAPLKASWKYSTIVLTLALLTTSADAEISYDYVAAGFNNASFDSFEFAADNLLLAVGDLDAEGYALEGSYSFGGNYFAYTDLNFSSFSLPDFDLGNERFVSPDVDLSTQVVGGGYHSDGDQQFVAKVAFLRRSVDAVFFKEATLGYVIDLGGRGLINENFEWEASVDFTDFDAGDDPKGQLGVNAALRYHFGKSFSTDVSASTTEDVVRYGLNFRLNFAR